MPLARTEHSAIVTPEDISFLMADGERLVRVDVCRVLLTHVARSTRRSPGECMVALEDHRNQLERIASAKYDEGKLVYYANSHVVTIKADDWMQRFSVDSGASAAHGPAAPVENYPDDPALEPLTAWR